MISIYICSTETCAGKTTLAVGLAKLIARRGSKVAYFKPVSVSESNLNGNRVDEDAAFAKQVLSLGESIEVLSPMKISSGKGGSTSVEPELIQRIKDSFASISRDKDVVVAEGPQVLDGGAHAGVPVYKVVEMLDAKVLLVVRYRGDTTVRKVTEAIAFLGRQPSGIIINAVPKEQFSYVSKAIVPELERNQLPILGILPLERELLGASASELASYLSANVISGQDSLSGAIESVMIGARSFSSGLPYFSRKENKAVVTGIDRPDIQMAALETSTRCIVMTGDGDPDPLVLQRAKEVQVPLIRVPLGTIETVDRIEQFLTGTRFRQAQKTQRVDKLIETGINLTKLSTALGLV